MCQFKPSLTSTVPDNNYYESELENEARKSINPPNSNDVSNPILWSIEQQQQQLSNVVLLPLLRIFLFYVC